MKTRGASTPSAISSRFTATTLICAICIISIFSPGPLFSQIHHDLAEAAETTPSSGHYGVAMNGEGTCFVACGADGIRAYKYGDGSLIFLAEADGLPHVNDVAIDQDGYIYAVGNGLSMYRFSAGSFTRVARRDDVYGNSVAVDSTGTVFVVHISAYIRSFIRKDSVFLQTAEMVNYPDDLMYSIAIHDGTIFIASDYSLTAYTYDDSTITAVDRIHCESEWGTEALDVAIDSSGTIYLATDSKGLSCWRYHDGSFIRFDDLSYGSYIQCVDLAAGGLICTWGDDNTLSVYVTDVYTRHLNLLDEVTDYYPTWDIAIDDNGYIISTKAEHGTQLHQYIQGEGISARDAVLPNQEITWEKQIIDNNLSPSVLTVADLDGDGNRDILATAWEIGDVVWYRNDCDARLWTERAFGANLNNPIGVSIGDVNNDDQPDVVVASRGSDEIFWFENALSDNQAPQWEQHLITNSIASPNQVYVADLDDDDNLDVVVSPAQGSSVYWVKNGGSAQGPWQVYTIDSSITRPRKLAVGDVNGDGAIDIAAASSDLNEIRLYMTSGGVPVNWTTYTVDNNLGGARAVFMGDVDGDGDQDIAATGVRDHSIVYYENTGTDPTAWPKHVVDSTFNDARVVSIADINNGGLPDILASSTSENRLVWYAHENNWQRIDIPEASVSGARSFFVADMDNDKDIAARTDLDIIVAAQASKDVIIFRNELIPTAPEIDFQPTALDFGTVNVGDTIKLSLDLSNAGTGLLQISSIRVQGPEPVPFSIDDTSEMSIYSCDKPSIIVSCLPQSAGIWKDTLVIHCNDPDRSIVVIPLMANSTSLQDVSWKPLMIDANLKTPSVLSIADLDGDSDLDIVATAWQIGDVVWYRNECHSLTWTKHTIHPNVRDAIGVKVGDIDGDSLPDVVVASSGDHEVLWFENTLPDTLSKQWPLHIVATNVTDPGWIDLADLNDDGKLDVLISPDVGSTFYWYENEGGTPIQWSQHTVDNSLAGPRQIQTADINGDGAMDIVAAGEDADEVHVFLSQNGIPTNWTKHTLDNDLDGAISVWCGDIDGDSDLDIAATGRIANAVVYYENTGSDPSTWPKHVIDTNLHDSRHVVIADIDNGGLPDIVATSYKKNLLVWYRQESNWQKIEISDNSLGGARNFSVVDMDNGRDIEGNTDLDIVALAQTSNDVILFNNELIPAAPDIDFQPTAMNFGKVYVGDTTKRSLHLSNSGTVLLQISAIQILGPRPTPFSLENTTAFSLNSCEVDSIVILCTPLDTGIWAGTLIISSNDNRDSVVTIELIVDRVTDVDDAPIPRSLRLSQNFPNPFNPSTEIICEIPSYGRTRLSVHDLLGREVALLINDLKPAGTYHVRFDGNGIPSGVYVYRILWNDRSISRKMILMK